VLRQTLVQARRWQAQGLVTRFSVNLSARSLLDPALLDGVRALLAQTSLAPGALTLEITESAIMADPFRALRALEHLRELGIRLSIDDFGAGYSSLAYLKRLPVEEIKIDKSFVLAMTTEGEDAAIVRSTIELARNLGLETVAEGVESQHAWDDLRRLGCDLIQGYHLTPPLPADALLVWATQLR
jgi:EAL domain-containing protein (putative c-di-GMP-specific phosphodiesterase class I)